MQLSIDVGTAMLEAVASYFTIEEDADPFQLVIYAGEMDDDITTSRDDLTPLAVLDLPSPAFGAISGVIGDEESFLEMAAFSIPPVLAVSDGDVAYWRIYDSANLCAMQGIMGEGDITVSTPATVEGVEISVNGLKLIMPLLTQE